MESVTIASQSMVSISFRMFDETGLLLEERTDSDPVTYLQGSQSILPVLQEQLSGLKAGDSKRVCLPAMEELGGKGFFFDVFICAVREALPVEIELGYPLPTGTEDCGSDCNCHKLMK